MWRIIVHHSSFLVAKSRSLTRPCSVEYGHIACNLCYSTGEGGRRPHTAPLKQFVVNSFNSGL